MKQFWNGCWIWLYLNTCNMMVYWLKKLHGFESASELYRSSDRRRSAKLVPTLVDRWCHVVSATSPSDCNFDSLDPEPLLFLPSSSSIVHEAEWTPFQTHCCSEKSGNAGNLTRDPCVSSQKLWPLDHRVRIDTKILLVSPVSYPTHLYLSRYHVYLWTNY
jgi:hypothetical protein